jgi:hypothetical protein
MSKEALKLALEALKIAQNNLAPSKHSAHAFGDGELWDMYADAIKALEETLAKQEQGEPVAWLWELTGEVTTDPDRADGMWNPLYTTPQQRTWVRLDWSDLPDEWVGKPAFMEGAKWAERKLKEKNT